MASAYLVAAWGLSMGVEALFPVFGAPDWAVRAFVITAFLCFPIVVALAWIFEVTDEGVVRDPRDRPAPAVATDNSAETMVLSASRGPVTVSWTEAGEPRRRGFHGAFMIGRDGACEVHLDDPAVSRKHASITQEDGVWTITDLNSANGTYLDGKRITTSMLQSHSVVNLAEEGPQIVIDVSADDSASTMVLQPGSKA